MRATTMLALILLTQSYQLTCQSLNYTIEENSVVYRKVIEIDSVNKDNLFNRALQYFTFRYSQGDNVIQIKDKDHGIIVGKGFTPSLSNVSYKLNLQSLELGVWHIIKIEIKDYKVRVSFFYGDYQIIWRGDTERIRESHILLEPPISSNPGKYINSQLYSDKAFLLTNTAFEKIKILTSIEFKEIEKFLKNTSSNSDW